MCLWILFNSATSSSVSSLHLLKYFYIYTFLSGSSPLMPIQSPCSRVAPPLLFSIITLSIFQGFFFFFALTALHMLGCNVVFDAFAYIYFWLSPHKYLSAHNMFIKYRWNKSTIHNQVHKCISDGQIFVLKMYVLYFFITCSQSQRYIYGDGSYILQADQRIQRVGKFLSNSWLKNENDWISDPVLQMLATLWTSAAALTRYFHPFFITTYPYWGCRESMQTPHWKVTNFPVPERQQLAAGCVVRWQWCFTRYFDRDSSNLQNLQSRVWGGFDGCRRKKGSRLLRKECSHEDRIEFTLQYRLSDYTSWTNI